MFLCASVCNPGFIIPLSCCRHCSAAGHTSSLAPLLGIMSSWLFPQTVPKSAGPVSTNDIWEEDVTVATTVSYNSPVQADGLSSWILVQSWRSAEVWRTMRWHFRIIWWISRIFLTHVCNTHVLRANSRTGFFFNRMRLESWSNASLASGHVSCRSHVYVDTSNQIKSLTRIKVPHVNTDLILTRSLKSNFPGLYRSSLQHVSPTSDMSMCCLCRRSRSELHLEDDKYSQTERWRGEICDEQWGRNKSPNPDTQCYFITGHHVGLKDEL